MPDRDRARDYNTFRGVMTEAFLAAFGRDTMDSLYKRLIFDMAGIRYGPTKELNGEEKSRLMSALKGLKDGIRDMTEILLEKGRACLGGEVVATQQIGLVSANQFVDRRASEAHCVDGGEGEGAVRESATADRVGPGPHSGAARA